MLLPHRKSECTCPDYHTNAPAFRYRRLLSRFDANIESPDPDFLPPSLKHTIPIIGFSATFSRHDGLALGSVFEQIVYHRDFLEMIKEQWSGCFLDISSNSYSGYYYD